MDSFEQELKAGFLEEASQLIVDAEQCFLLLESNPQDSGTLEKIFRIAHNIKGSSKAVGFDALGGFTHEFESFMLKCKNGQIPITPNTVSLLLKCNDHIKQYIDALKENQNAVLESQSLIDEIHNFKADNPESKVDESEVSSEKQDEQLEQSETPQEPTGDLEESISSEEVQLLQATQAPESVEESNGKGIVSSQCEPIYTENTASTKTTGSPAPRAAPSSSSSNGPAATEESIRVSLSRLEKLINFVGEMVILQTVLKEQAYSDNMSVMRKTVHQMGKVTKEVQDLSMSLRMVPLKQTFQKMQRIVRDTSSILGKKVQLVLQGEETEVDKTVLEALSDPLVHLIRNAVDHGIEMPDARSGKGKNETGTVTLRAYHESGKLVIEVKDDGGGISGEKLQIKAVEKGILKPNQALSEKEGVNLIFHPGFSTKEKVTEVSGRGVGMDVVKTNIEHMQGDVLIETVVGQGSTFKIILPLTLAIIDGMVVRCGDERFVIPLAHVHESVKPEPKDLRFATGVGEVLLLRGENLPVMRLAQALGKKKSAKASAETEQIAIIIRTQAQAFAALVDDVIGQHQVVIKKLGAEVQNLKGFSGSAILGDGRPALILELSDLNYNKRQVAA